MVNDVNNNVNNDAKRDVGEGTFSLGSATKGGYLSIKIDMNDEEKTKAMIKKLIDLSRWLLLQKEVEAAMAM